MRTVVVGGGPAGTICAMALARRGNDVIVVDRDPGPPPTTTVRISGAPFGATLVSSCHH